MEVRTTRLMQGFLWKQGATTGLWVRRYYVLIRREQIDEMVNAASDVLHELCCFDSGSEHAEVLGTKELEQVVSFDSGIDAGFAPHEKLARQRARENERKQSGKAAMAASTSSDFGNTKRTLFTGLFEMFPIKFSTDEIADYTMQLTFPDRVLRLRAETKSAFDNWRALFATIIPPSRAEIMHEGWVWRQRGSRWQQRYAIIYEGVLFFFLTYEESEKFRQVASRGPDSMFVAAPLAEDCIGLGTCVVSEHHVWEDRNFVLHFAVEDPPLSEYLSTVDEVQSKAWALAAHNACHWFETIPDDHPSRRLFGGLGGEEEGPMLASNTNPLAQLNEQNAADLAAAEAQRKIEEKERERRRKAKAHAKKKKKKAAKKKGKGKKGGAMSEFDRFSSRGSHGSRGSRGSDSSRSRSNSPASIGSGNSRHSSPRMGSSGAVKKDTNKLVRRAMAADAGGSGFSHSPHRAPSNSSTRRDHSPAGGAASLVRTSSGSSSAANSPAIMAAASSSSAMQRVPSIGGKLNAAGITTAQSRPKSQPSALSTAHGGAAASAAAGLGAIPVSTSIRSPSPQQRPPSITSAQQQQPQPQIRRPTSSAADGLALTSNPLFNGRNANSI